MLPGQVQEGLISALQGHLYALATPDGRVRAYDTVTGRLRCRLATAAASESIQGNGGLPNGHLADGLQCLAWVESEASAKARSSNPASTSSLAVGTAAGIVRAYDSATGSVRWQAQDCNDGGVTCLAHAGPHGLVCSGRDGQVACLDPATGAVRRRFRGSKHAVTGGTVAPDGSKLLIGGSTLALLDVESGSRIAKFSGHTMPVRAVAFAPSGNNAITAAPSERSIAVWNTSGSKKAKKLGGVAVASLPVDDAAVALCTCDAPGSEPGAFYAAAVTEAGEAFVWLCTPEGESAVLAAAAGRVRVGDAKVAPGSGPVGVRDAILAAGLEPADGGATLVVVRGSSAKPVFERVPIAAPPPGQQQQHQQQPTHCLEPIVEGALLKGGKQQQQQQQAVKARSGGAAAAANGPLADVDMLGPENDGALVRPRAAAAAAGKKRTAPDQEEDEEAAAAAGDGDAGASSDDEGLDAEETLGARVAALELGEQAAGEDADAAAATAAGAALLDGAVKADSLAVLLQQALRSGDKALLERCLGLSDARVVRNSVRRLLPVDAAALLRACVERLQSRPVRGQQLAGWIRAVLLHHTAYLMAAPGVQPVMTSLYQTIEARLATQRTLLSLSGRLDLLLAQSGPSGAAAGDDDGAAAAGPRAVYQESDSEDGGAEVVVEDAFAPRLGGDSDEDDEDEDDSLLGDDDDSGDEGEDSEGEDGSEGGSGDDMEEDE